MHLHFILCLFTIYLSMAVEGANTTNNIAKPGCPTHCGNVTVPYPFGIGDDCSLTNFYSLICNTSFQPPRLSFQDSTNQIYEISEKEVRISTIVSYSCYNHGGLVDSVKDENIEGAMTVLSAKNKFTVIGCDDYALIVGTRVSSACVGLCDQPERVIVGECLGSGCCQVSIPRDIRHYGVTLQSLLNHSYVEILNYTCGYAFLVEEGKFRFGGVTDLSDNHLEFIKRIESTMPIVLDWSIKHFSNCTDGVVHVCKGESLCYDIDGYFGGYRCKCKEGYQGNPYLDQGCQDIDECSDQETYPCHGLCFNTQGSYNCVCRAGLVGNASILNGCKLDQHTKHLRTTAIMGVSISMGVLFLVAGIYFLYGLIKKIKERKRRNKFFKRNGGLLLKQQQGADSSLVDKTILFTSSELDKATDNFNENRILGRGGQGTVYKGMLVDGRIVAVKKSKLVDESQLVEFINEVVILSQVNHRNVVKLLGCCLETDVPLLVSEFISNGTLYDHLHNETRDFPISLNLRLQIATEVAGALAYLHSATSIPIYHRDIKTSNILLDDTYRAKVSDFGTSRFVSIGQTHLTTMVKGTFGYLDPEYFQTSQFTEKSDVYSFGVVLVELLTREKSISLTRFGQNRSLATHFMSAMEEGRVMSIFDIVVVKEGTSDELLALANLAMQCLNLNGKYRPTMKEVATQLEMRRTSHIPHAVQTNRTSVIYAEELHMAPYGESSSTY